MHSCDSSFGPNLQLLYPDAETQALESLFNLKVRLREAAPDHWWKVLLQGLAIVTGSQYAFVSKHLSVDPAEPSLSLPLLGEPGSCLKVLHSIYDDGLDFRYAHANVTYHATSCPCSEMRHGKVFFMPSGFTDVYPNVPNRSLMVLEPEAYMGIPLFLGNRCFAHFALMWSARAIAEKKLGWGFIELLCHSVEDLVAQQLRDSSDASDPSASSVGPLESVLPAMVQSTTQILARHAETLSHELRTPMQGIVGTLDLMRTTLERGKETKERAGANDVLWLIDEDLEAVQESAGRAIEAADNIVRAYELNLGYLSSDTTQGNASRPKPASKRAPSSPPSTLAAIKDDSRRRVPLKRRRSASDPEPLHRVKIRASTGSLKVELLKERSPSRDSAIEGPFVKFSSARPFQKSSSSSHPTSRKHSTYSPKYLDAFGRGLQLTDIRDIIERVVREGVKTGIKPSMSIISVSQHGELLHVQSTTNNGSISTKTVEWSVDPSVPSFLLVDERSLAKAISCIFRNSVKFTDEGHISLRATFCEKDRIVKINLKDTGPGISPAFRSEIFEPFSKEDKGTTRRTEGLGLGLMVAKGLSHKLGGDLTLVSADTSGWNRGTEFVMHIPASPSTQGAGLRTPSATLQDGSLKSPGDGEQSPEQGDEEAHHRSMPNDFGTAHSPPDYPSPKRSRSSTLSSARTSPFESPNFSFSSTGTMGLDRAWSPPTSASANEVSSRPFFRRSIPYDPVPTVPAPFVHLPPPISPSQISASRSAKAQPDDTSISLETVYPCNILVAEDNAVNRRLLVSMLTKLGYNPMTSIWEAIDGQDAVDQVRRSMFSTPSAIPDLQTSTVGVRPLQSGRPHLRQPTAPIEIILMDLWMPNKDGFEASMEILQLYTKFAETHPNVRPPTILAVTADATDGAAEKAAKAGMRGLLLKPFKIKDLSVLVRQGCLMRELADVQVVEAFVG